jgi:hypothetical protein
MAMDEKILTPQPPLCYAKRGCNSLFDSNFPPHYEVEMGKRRG